LSGRSRSELATGEKELEWFVIGIEKGQIFDFEESFDRK
jgi:hypothetical protein